MIELHCFEKEWIDSFRKQKGYEKINPPLLDKMIHALSTLQYLQTQGLHFTFKGGTSLMLLLDKATRFSVDIDIITEESRETIEKVLDKVVESSHFVSWRLDAKRSYKPGIPKAHYELEYNSQVNKKMIKQLYDLGTLFNHIQSISEVANSFSSFAAQEIAYRNLTIEPMIFSGIPSTLAG